MSDDPKPHDERTSLVGHVAELLEDGFVAHDRHRRIWMFNAAAERITGRRRDEVLGRDCHEVFPPHGLCGPECDIFHRNLHRQRSGNTPWHINLKSS